MELYQTIDNLTFHASEKTIIEIEGQKKHLVKSILGFSRVALYENRIKFELCVNATKAKTNVKDYFNMVLTHHDFKNKLKYVLDDIKHHDFNKLHRITMTLLSDNQYLSVTEIN